MNIEFWTRHTQCYRVKYECEAFCIKFVVCTWLSTYWSGGPVVLPGWEAPGWVTPPTHTPAWTSPGRDDPAMAAWAVPAAETPPGIAPALFSISACMNSPHICTQIMQDMRDMAGTDVTMSMSFVVWVTCVVVPAESRTQQLILHAKTGARTQNVSSHWAVFAQVKQ